ncbi:TolC family protein [Oligoflexia bacterium]|nr:TolC family protein [Oligoflexia bacterium]
MFRNLFLLLCFCLFAQILQAEENQKVDYFYDETLVAEEAQAVKNKKEKSEEDRLTLPECIQVAFEHNAEIRTARARIKEQQGVRLEAKAVLLPKLGAEAGYTRVDKESLPSVGGLALGNDEAWQTQIQVIQPLFTGGRGLALRRQAKNLEQASALEFASVVNQTVFGIKQAFYDVLLARSRVKVRKQSVKLLAKQLELEKNKLKAGTVSDFNVLRAEVELANAKTPHIKARNDLRLALEELSKLLGRPVEDPHEVKTSLRIAGEFGFEDLVLDLPAAMQTATEQRPELKRYQVLEEAAEHGVDVARAGYFPTFDLFGGYGWTSQIESESLSDVDQGWQTGVNATWQIFDGLATKGRVKQAKASKDQIRIARTQELLNINVEVRRALSDLVQARELVYASRKVVEQAEESLRLVTARNDAGVARQIDVLDTQVALTDARNNHIESLYAFNVAKAALEKATGVNAGKA